MMPFYGFADPAHSLLPNQHHNPGFVSPHMNGDVPRSGWGYGHWPFYGCNMMGYPAPGPCHSCFNHRNFPDYPAGPHQFQCCGYQSPVPGVGNVQYVVPPPPHFVMQPPRYEYDKWVPGERHCCGCPNHNHSQRSDREVKVVEEPEPDAGKKESTSLVPFKLDGHQYPVAWAPNGLVKDPNEQVKAPEPTSDVNRGESESRVPNGWFPLDLKNLESLMKAQPQAAVGVLGGEEHANSKRQFPFPVLWFPAKNMETNADKEVSGQGKSDDKSEQKLPSVPDRCEGFTELQKLQDRDDGKADPGLEVKKQNSPRIIEVKQISAPNSDVNLNVVGKASESTLKKQSSSKLPPVCLRVEPLSKKKKNGNASRSPSPPKSKSSSPQSQLEANLKRDLQGRKDPTSDMKEVEEMRRKEHVIQAVEAPKIDAQVGEIDTTSPPQVPVKLTLDTRKLSEPNEAGGSCATEATEPREETKANCGDTEVQKKFITEEEAALHIQSVYRGYNVRRWEPLKKLKQIAQVRDQLTDVRSRIDALHSSDLQKDDKQTAMIGEMIMSLLLKLDTIQGLHSFIREMRKSVARELVALQERLDAIKIENEISRAKHGVNKREPVQQDGNNEMLEARDGENRDLSFSTDDVQESKVGSEINGGEMNVGLQDSELENNYAPEINHEEKSDSEKCNSTKMEATTDVCREERDPQHGKEVEEDSPENLTTARAFGCLTSGNEIPEEEQLPQESLPGLSCAMGDKMFENPEHQECKIVHGNAARQEVSTDAASSQKEGSFFKVDKEDLAYEMDKCVSADGSENLVDGEPRCVNESLEFSESKEAPSFDLKEQPEKETKDEYSVGEKEGTIEGETENLSENSESATFEEAELQTDSLDDVDGRPYAEALQTPEKLPNELCDGEGSYDRDVEVDPAPEQKNIDVAHGEDELLTDGNVTEERAEDVKASEEAREVEQSETDITISNGNSNLVLNGPSAIDKDIVIASDVAATKEHDDGVNQSSVPSSDSAKPFMEDQMLAEENAKLRETMEKLIEAGKEHLSVISNLTGRVKDLEHKLSKKKRKQTRRCRTTRSPLSRSRASKDLNNGALPTL